jgi:DNA-binding SARP family transcriptional activator
LSLEGTNGADSAMPKGRRPLALLALLATSGPRGLSRDKVTALLWPESDAERSRNSLSQVLSSLRRDIGPEDLVLGTAEIRLNADAITSDVEEFEATVAHGDVERAAAIQSGPFLDGFYLTDAPEFERWVEEQRTRLNEKQRDALHRLALDAERRGDRAAALQWWRQLVLLDPTSARAAVGLMEALAASGDGAAALRHFQTYSALLEQELHAEPDAVVVRLAERLRRGSGATREAIVTAPMPTPADTTTAIPRNAVTTVAAVGIAASPPSFWRRTGMVGVYGVAALALLVGAFMVVRAAGVGPFASLLSSGRLGPNELLLVADFTATGPDSALSGPLAEMMRSGLSQSRVIEIVPVSRVANALARMARSPETKVDLRLAREIAQREGIKAVVGGSLAPLSGGYLISTQLVLASTGDVLASFQETADGPRDVVAAVDRLSRKLRGRIGESLKSVRADPPLADVTTASLEALERYTEAMQANAAREYSRAVALLEEAIALDSNFGMAYRQWVLSINNSRSSRIGIGGEQSNQGVRMRLMSERAYQHRDRLPERERLLMESLHYSLVADRAKRRAADEKLLEKYPRAAGAANAIALALMGQWEFARAESVFTTLIAGDTSVSFPYGNIVSAQIAQGKLADARRSIERLVRRFPDMSSQGDRYRSELQYALGHVDSSERILRQLAASRSQTDRLYARNILTAYALLHGQVANVRPQLEEATALVKAAGGRSLALQDTITVAQIQLVFLKRPEVAVRMLDRALPHARRDSVLAADGALYLRAASLYALARRPDKAREVLALYGRDVYDPNHRRRNWVTANIDLAEGRARVAATEFRQAGNQGPFEQCVVCTDPDVGRAFDRAGMPDSAIAVFEHFVNTPSVQRVIADAWNLPLLLRRLGELHEARGDSAAAAQYYQKFVTLWKDADPELRPVVADVRRRLKRLGL